MKESDIIHETANFSLVKVKNKLEIHLKGNTHAICVGRPSRGVNEAAKTMVNLENNVDKLRKWYKHY